MALVVFLKGLNVGGHRLFRPTALARELRHLDAVNIGAAGTFVIFKPVSRRQLREEIGRLLPVPAEIMICSGQDIAGLVARDFFAGHAARPEVVQFVSVLSRAPRTAPALPIQLPARGPWLVKVIGRDRQFIVGLYRRQMKVIGQLRLLDRLFGAPVTTRNWKTITAISRALTP